MLHFCNASPRGQFVEQKLELISSFRRDQIHNCQRYVLGHTLLLDLEVKQTRPSSFLFPFSEQITDVK
jgi:hypothetical protein